MDIRANYQSLEIADTLNLTPPTMEQPQYNLLERFKMEKDYLPVFDKYQLGTTIWSPLSSGILSGKYIDNNPSGTRTSLKGYEFIKKKYESDSFIDVHRRVKQLKELSKNAGLPLVNLAICWCLKNSNVSTVILGASKLAQLQENLNSSKYMNMMTDELMNEIEIILNNNPLNYK